MKKHFGVTTAYNSRGFGFIRRSSGKSEILFHICDWQSEITPGSKMVVSFEVASSKNRKFTEQAINVQVVTAEEAANAAITTPAAPVDITKAAEVLAGPTTEQEAK